MIDKEMIAQLSGEIQERISTEMDASKMQRMQKFATDGKIDATNLMAFVLSEAKLFTQLYTTDFLMTIAEYEEMQKKAADGTLELEVEKEFSDHPLEMTPDFDLYKVGDVPPENMVVQEAPSALEMLEQREAMLKSGK